MQKHEVVIENVAFGGDGVGRIDGMVCFVPGTIPSERIELRVLERKRDFLRGELLRVIEPSSKRIQLVCPLAFAPGVKLVCPGCSYQHISYDAELDIKHQQFCDLLSRQGGDPAAICLEPVGSPISVGYRNKIVMHVSKDGVDCSVGYFGRDNVSVIDVDCCPLACDAINGRLTELRNDRGFSCTLRDKMKLTFRYSTENDVVFWRNQPKRNMSWLRDATSAGEMSFPVDSFAQINPWVRDLVVEKAVKLMNQFKPDTVMDLFSGTGLFSLAAGKSGVRDICGIDSDTNAIAAAAYNCKKAGLTQAHFFSANAFKSPEQILARVKDGSRSLLIVDPPRAGIGANLAKCIEKAAFSAILYISCAPDTLARDLRLLCSGSYRLTSAQLFDMFPRTAHFESMSWLEREGTI